MFCIQARSPICTISGAWSCGVEYRALPVKLLDSSFFWKHLLASVRGKVLQAGLKVTCFRFGGLVILVILAMIVIIAVIEIIALFVIYGPKPGSVSHALLLEFGVEPSELDREAARTVCVRSRTTCMESIDSVCKSLTPCPLNFTPSSNSTRSGNPQAFPPPNIPTQSLPWCSA